MAVQDALGVWLQNELKFPFFKLFCFDLWPTPARAITVCSFWLDESKEEKKEEEEELNFNEDILCPHGKPESASARRVLFYTSPWLCHPHGLFWFFKLEFQH